MQFWRLNQPNSTRGMAETDNSELKRLETQYGEMMPWFRMCRVPNVPQPIKLGGSSVKDFTWTWYCQCIIQDRVLQMFRNEGFTGFQVHPISAKWKRRPKIAKHCIDNVDAIPKLWELIPIGWGGVAPEESGVHLLRIRPSDRRRTYSKFTDPSRLISESQWDGSDFFILWPLAGHIFITDRVAQFIKKEKLAGAVLTRIQDMRWPGGIGDECMPGQLRYYLPEPRAREIGEPLGIY